MTGKLDYRWHLRKVMASRGMFSTTDLLPQLAERGIYLSPSQAYRLVAEKPQRLRLRTLMALLDILGCTMTDLIEPMPAGVRRPHKATSDGCIGKTSEERFAQQDVDSPKAQVQTSPESRADDR